MLSLLISTQLLILSTVCDSYDYSGVVIGNLRRRDSIPLHQLGMRGFEIKDDDENLQYRKTIDIRQDRTFEFTENLIRQAKLQDKYHREQRWLTIDTDEGIGIGI